MKPGPTARGVVVRAVATVRKHWRPILLVALAVYIPVGLLEVIDDRVAEAEDVSSGGAVATGLAVATTALLGEVMLAGTIVAAIGDPERGPRGRALWHVLHEIPYGRLLAITLLSVAGFALGLLLFIVPAIVFLGRFMLAAPVAEVEDLGVRDAFARSYALTRGHFLLVLGVLVPLTLVSGTVSAAAEAAGRGLLGEGLVAEWIRVVVAEFLVATPWALAAVALVYELKAAEDR